MTEQARSVDDLADVREGFDPPLRWEADEKVAAAEAALSELVALVGTLTQERDEARETLALHESNETKRAEAAEAALAELQGKHEHLLSEFNYEGWRGDHLVYAHEWDEFNDWQRNGKQALADMRRALDEAWFEERHGIDPAGNATVEVWCRRCGVTHQRPEHCPARRALAAAGPAHEETT